MTAQPRYDGSDAVRAGAKDTLPDRVDKGQERVYREGTIASPD